MTKSKAKTHGTLTMQSLTAACSKQVSKAQADMKVPTITDKERSHAENKIKYAAKLLKHASAGFIEQLNEVSTEISAEFLLSDNYMLDKIISFGNFLLNDNVELNRTLLIASRQLLKKPVITRDELQRLYVANGYTTATASSQHSTSLETLRVYGCIAVSPTDNKSFSVVPGSVAFKRLSAKIGGVAAATPKAPRKRSKKAAAASATA